VTWKADHLLNVSECVLSLLITAAAPPLSSDGAFPAAFFIIGLVEVFQVSRCEVSGVRHVMITKAEAEAPAKRYPTMLLPVP
jgi:hypothetical protein